MPDITDIQFKRKKSGSAYNGILNTAEPLYDEASKRLYVGDGKSVLSALDYIGKRAEISADVSTTIDGKKISDIFETDGITVKNATVAAKVGTSTIGASDTPVYVLKGVVTALSKYAGATRLTLNGVSKSADSASIFAPTRSGAIGQVLMSGGINGEPSWSNALSLTVGSAMKATSDSSGNAFASSYGSQISAVSGSDGKSITLRLLSPNNSIISSTSMSVEVSGVSEQSKSLQISNGTYQTGDYFLNGANFNNLNASTITSGTLSFSRLPTMYWADIAISSGKSTSASPTFNSVTATSAKIANISGKLNGIGFTAGSDSEAMSIGDDDNDISVYGQLSLSQSTGYLSDSNTDIPNSYQVRNALPKINNVSPRKTYNDGGYSSSTNVYAPIIKPNWDDGAFVYWSSTEGTTWRPPYARKIWLNGTDNGTAVTMSWDENSQTLTFST